MTMTFVMNGKGIRQSPILWAMLRSPPWQAACQENFVFTT